MINDNYLKPGNQDKAFALVSETAARATMDHNGFNNAFFNGRITQLVQLIVIYNDCQFQTKRYFVPALRASSIQTKTITFVSVLYHTGHLNSSSLADTFQLSIGKVKFESTFQRFKFPQKCFIQQHSPTDDIVVNLTFYLIDLFAV